MSRSDTDRDIVATLGQVPEFFKDLPDAQLEREWATFKEVQLGDSALSAREKHLIGYAVAAATHCPYCTYFHQSATKMMGTSDEQLEEARERKEWSLELVRGVGDEVTPRTFELSLRGDVAEHDDRVEVGAAADGVSRCFERARAVHEAEDKMPLCNQTIYVAAPNYHLLIERNRSLSLSIDEPVHHSRPAIDVLFESAADAYGPAVAGLVLSGANQDGAEGLCQIRQAGGVAIVQAPATASSPMMPETAMRRVGPSAHVVRLVDLGAFLARLVGAKTRGGDLL